ncbi:sigma-70 family RNA polymerase sigma factor [Pseudalkalibacillus sp. A8]|uniref:sigma-70 family RNA polymerase sigma factor n=1 Tax=Pseudalkalibacillus sp. A8 TaxID=3382641 RepID=UPI0038B54BB2
MYARPGIHVQNDKVKTIEIEELYSKLKRYCHFLSQNKWDGDDLAQETMFKAMERYGDRTELNGPLLKKMAHNLWIDQLRKRNREVIGSMPEEIDRDTNNFDDLVEQLVSELTPKQSVIYTLKEAFRYQISEIAEIFGMTETAVKAVLNRARKRLAKIASDGNDDSIPVIGHMSEEDDGELTRTLIQAIRSEDPSVLIKLIPTFFPIETQPKLKLMNFSSPSSSLSMAA